MGYASDRKKELNTKPNSYSQKRKLKLEKIAKQGPIGPVQPKKEPTNYIKKNQDTMKTLLPSFDYNKAKEEEKLNKIFNVQPKSTPRYDNIPEFVSAAAGLGDSATLGLLSAQANRENNSYLPELDSNKPSVSKFLSQAKEQNPKSYLGGQVAGYLIPGTGIEKASAAALKPIVGGATKLGSKVAGKTLTGAITGAGQEFAEGAIRGLGDGEFTANDFKDLSKRTATGAVFGAAGDVALAGLNKGVKKLVSKAEITNNINPDTLSATNKNTSIAYKPANDILSQQNKSNVITPKELPSAANKNIAANISNNSSTLNIPVGKGFADDVIAKSKVDNERGFSFNVRTDKAMNNDIRKAFDENSLTYEPLSNKITLAKAEEKMSKGFTQAYANWNKSTNSFDPSDIPLARKLANEAAKNGDMVTARQIISDVSEKLTQAGQYSQAAAILRKSDPATFNAFIDNQFKKLNEEGQKVYGNKWNDFSLTDDEIKQLYDKDIIDEESREKVMENIYNRVSQSMPSSKMEKFDAWRRTAMLLNPKTHVRNVVGNAIMGVMRKSADTLGTGLEKIFLKEGQRTKSLGWSLDKNLSKTVDNAWELEQKNLTSSNRYDINNLKFMNRDKRIFKNAVLNKLDNFSKEALNVEDKIFLERAYKDALGGYMKSNNLKETTQASKDYAQRRAFEATFKQANFLSDTINKIKRKKGIGKLVEGAIPFTQTPANIMMRSVEYSPLGIVKALFSVTNKEAGAQVIEDLTKGLTGTAALGVGFVLASMGAAKYQKSKSDTAAGLETEVGEQSSSIITPWGSYTFDWAQPAAIPLAMGISFYEGLQKKDASKAEALLNAIYAGGDTIVSMTMLKNIKDLLGNGGSVSQKIAGIPVSYVEQAIPSLFGQMARTTDPIKRNTYDPSPVKKELNKIQSKIPGLSKNLEPDINVFGETQNNGGWFQQFISPGYAKSKTNDAVSKELIRLYKSNKETDFLPKYLDGTFSKDGTEYQLSAKELTDFRQKVGQETKQRIKSIIDTPNYKLASDDIKMNQLKSIVNVVYNNYKNEYIKSKN